MIGLLQYAIERSARAQCGCPAFRQDEPPLLACKLWSNREMAPRTQDKGIGGGIIGEDLALQFA